MQFYSKFQPLQNPQHIYNGQSKLEEESSLNFKGMKMHKLNYKSSISQFHKKNGHYTFNAPKQIQKRKLYNLPFNDLKLS